MFTRVQLVQFRSSSLLRVSKNQIKQIKMKAFFISVTLLIIAMFIIPVGGMCESNVNHEYYMYGFLGCEILCVLSLLRIFVKRKTN